MASSVKSSGEQTEHVPWARPQFELGEHGAGKRAEDAAQGVKDTLAVLRAVSVVTKGCGQETVRHALRITVDSR